MSENINRRGFIQKTALAGAGIALAPSLLKAQSKGGNAPVFKNLVDLSRKIRVAAVGCGGQAVPNLSTIRNANRPGTNEKYAEFVAFCDVDFDRASHRFDEDSHVPRYKDYRKMFAEMKDQIDAVIVTTPDHMHYPVAALAISLGKHVYVEKPATHTIGEARALKALAKKMGVVTQMGNHGHAYDGCRLLRDWIEYGVIGDVTEIHIWTNRPGWPQGIDMDTREHKIPQTLDWNLWLGVSPEVPFSPEYVPFNWRGAWNWGTGAIGDMACHMMDPIFTAIDLRGDVKVTPFSEGATDFSPGKRGTLVYEFAPTPKRKAVKLHWYEGGLKPKLENLPEGAFTEEDLKRGNGMIYIGTKGAIMDTDDYGNKATLMPKEKDEEFRKNLRKNIPEIMPRVLPHRNSRLEFMDAIFGGPVPGSNLVDHSADLTELGLLGILAFRMNKVIDWDHKKGVARGLPEANKFIHKDYRMF